MENSVAALGLTTRSVSTVEHDGRPARRQLMTRSFPTDPKDLWDALTNPDRIPRWFLPVSGDLRVGGHYQLEGNAGGVVEECEPPHRFRVTWGMGEQTSWLTVTLEPDGAATRLELEHVGEVPGEMWEQFGPNATGLGWDMAIWGLGLHLKTGAPNDPAEVAAWMASPDAMAFMEGSGRAWQEADLADGTDPDEAAARVARTIAVYTGQAEPPSHD